MRALLFATLLTATLTTNAMALDIPSLWNFGQPQESEQRFRAALATANPDEAFILQTQIARSYGLRRDFTQARAILKTLEPQLHTVSAVARSYYALELGRSYASATHPPESQTEQTRTSARVMFEQAYTLAREAQRDDLAIDALHMQAFIDTTPADQLKWADAALAIAVPSTQPAGKKWEASLRNNKGYALHQLGRYDEALAEFETALVLRKQSPNGEATRIAQWMVAWTLRAMGRNEEALKQQLQLERDYAAAKQPDPSVFEELAILYAAKGNKAKARHYEQLSKRPGK